MVNKLCRGKHAYPTFKRKFQSCINFNWLILLIVFDIFLIFYTFCCVFCECIILTIICLCGQSKALLLFLPACKGTQWMSQCLISPVSRGSRAPSLTAHSPLGRAACCCGPPGASPPGHTGSPPPAPRVRPQCSAYTCTHTVTARQLPKSPYPFILILILIMIIAIFFVNLVLIFTVRRIYIQYIQDYHPAMRHLQWEQKTASN